jgi:Na+/phosphate symporter
MVASVLISFATSLKLPLSTTYVTFMVAMGTSLSDRAWGRESAVYRVNGVITVIGGWFLTALMAFTVAAVFASLIYLTEIIAIVLLVLIAGYILFKTHILHKAREAEDEQLKQLTVASATNGTEVITAMFKDISEFLQTVADTLTNNLTALSEEDRVKLRDQKTNIKRIKKHSNLIVSHIINSVKVLKESEVKQGRRYGKIIASIQEIYLYVKEINQQSVDHIENNHGRPSDEQLEELKQLDAKIGEFVSASIEILNNKVFENTPSFQEKFDAINNSALKFDENELVRIKDNKVTSRNSMLYLNLLGDMENISAHISSLVNVCRKNYLKIVTPPTI